MFIDRGVNWAQMESIDTLLLCFLCWFEFVELNMLNGAELLQSEAQWNELNTNEGSACVNQARNYAEIKERSVEIQIWMKKQLTAQK